MGGSEEKHHSAVALVESYLPLVHRAPHRLFSSYQLGVPPTGAAPLLRDLFLSRLRHGPLLDNVHAVRNFEKQGGAPAEREPPETNRLLDACLHALDTGLCANCTSEACDEGGSPSRCMAVRRAIMLDRTATRREQCDWRQHDAEIHWLRRTVGDGHSVWYHTIDPSLLLTFEVSSVEWLAAVRPPAATSLLALPTPAIAAAHLRSASRRFLVPRTHPTSRPLRVGFISAHWGPTVHVLYLLQRGTFELRRASFEAHAFSLTEPNLEVRPPPTPITHPTLTHLLCALSLCRPAAALQVRAHVTSRLADAAHFHDLHELTAGQAADVIGNCSLQLLLWISEPQAAMHALLALRPAPLATTHIAVPATSGDDGGSGGSGGRGVGLPEYATFDRIALPPRRISQHVGERVMLVPHHYQINSHWFTYAVRFSGHGAMQTRVDPESNALLPGLGSRAWRWPRMSLANFGVTIHPPHGPIRPPCAGSIRPSLECARQWTSSSSASPCLAGGPEAWPPFPAYASAAVPHQSRIAVVWWPCANRSPCVTPRSACSRCRAQPIDRQPAGIFQWLY